MDFLQLGPKNVEQIIYVSYFLAKQVKNARSYFLGL